MAVKYDIEGEFSILRTICSENHNMPEVRAKLIPKLLPEHFSSSTSQNIYRRIVHTLKKSGYIPTWRDLANDPGVRKDARQAMRNVESKRLKTPESVDSTFKILEQYRRIRALYQLGINLEEGLEADEVDIEAILDKLRNDSRNIIDGTEESPIAHIGVNDNTNELIKQLLTTGGPRRIPTGFQVYDSQNIGIPIGSFVLLGATTSGGKSIMATQLAENMAMAGAKVDIVPLEMNYLQMLQRFLARVSDTDMTKLIDPKNRLSKAERKQIYKAWKTYQSTIEQRGGSINILEPKFIASMEATLEYLKPLDSDVIIIDYLGLLDGVGGDQQWQRLSEVTAYAKRWAEINGKIVIGLAQITQEGMLRYSQAMKEHASTAWFWVTDAIARELGMIEIKMEKARQDKMFNFLLKIDFATMTIRDPTKEELDDYHATLGKTENNKWGMNKSGKKKKAVTEEVEDFDDEEDYKPRRRNKSKDKQDSYGKVKNKPKSFDF